MNCFVCDGKMTPFIEKDFEMENLGKCEYVRCEDCGMTVSKTLYEMSHEKWVALNNECHEKLFHGELDTEKIDPHWTERLEVQAQLFAELVKRGVFKSDWRTIDYGAGNGTLANKIKSKLKKDWLKKFDAYMAEDESYLSVEEIKPASFDFLVTSSVFEHLLGNQGDVEKIIGLVKDDGVMALHTLICDEVPQDPNWFYLLPVHCTMWTNKAMAKVYKKFDFKGCAYNVESRMWFMFKKLSDFKNLESEVKTLPGTWQLDENFVEYWKVKPYRS